MGECIIGGDNEICDIKIAKYLTSMFKVYIKLNLSYSEKLHLS